MKAAIYKRYGPPEVVQIADVEKPVPKDNEVLLKVRAASVNPIDRHLMRGMYLLRPMTGLSKPRDPRLGRDVAGQVEAAGRNVTQFRPGDEVFGVAPGAFAEYVCSRENSLALKPANVTFEQAAAVPIAGLTALQGLRDKGRIQPGQKVLINGASGGVGTFAVQIAKSFDAHVTAVCSTRNVEMVRSIGADHVIDYTQQDFTQGGPEVGRRYDLLFDCVGNHSLSDCRRIIPPKGFWVIAGAKSPARMLVAPLLSPFVSQKIVMFIASMDARDLIVLKDLMEARKVTPIIDRRYRLAETAEAIRYLAEGHARAKVVITFQ